MSRHSKLCQTTLLLHSFAHAISTAASQPIVYVHKYPPIHTSYNIPFHANMRRPRHIRHILSSSLQRTRSRVKLDAIVQQIRALVQKLPSCVRKRVLEH